uniref:RNA-directed DNA polymerase, eukaryota, reverse transcriptase zinc-binding domain protein n=1 Tax=Tanacetum cinerariifolium TaxID=118510 RepID=A0A699HIR5_TANCI|nr:RNA-directed DNA polymerase, eukaryota, reverse transcriptase zinc-binding domain protein [Tanacetum cinerariifolium]
MGGNKGKRSCYEEELSSVAKKNSSPMTSKDDGEMFACSGNFKKVEIPHSKGFILQLMDDLVKAGHTIGYKMDGCIRNIEEIIENKGKELVEVPLGGCSLTLVYKIAAKMKVWSAPFPSKTNVMVRFMKKLKHLKQKVRCWVKVKKHSNKAQELILKDTLANIDSVLDKGYVNSNLLNTRAWIDSPDMVKNEFLSHFKDRFNHLGMFKGVSIGTMLHLSRLFYADDVIFIRKWSDSNVSTIVHVLDCFFKASGLRINMEKSKLMGIVVHFDKLNHAAQMIGCLTLKPLFSYLGIKVGGMMSRINSWDEIVNKLLARLSKWKMKTLSIGSFNGVEDNEKKMLWVRWKRVLAFKEKGGLCVVSFYSLNHALLLKWVWHFKNDSRSLWARVIQAFHGEDGSLSNSPKSSRASIWLDIFRDLTHIKKVYELKSFKKITVEAKLAHDNLGYSLQRYPRGGAEFEQFS